MIRTYLKYVFVIIGLYIAYLILSWKYILVIVVLYLLVDKVFPRWYEHKETNKEVRKDGGL